ncbi:hypothetical protein ACGFSB_16415 [Streptomyces sp. NPDC048441]|uniref:hypothetical protein n=1 Tax=Streptomyces sp. NPDC048441 TaxID=3365552 RepID=UPI0037202B9A
MPNQPPVWCSPRAAGLRHSTHSTFPRWPNKSSPRGKPPHAVAHSATSRSPHNTIHLRESDTPQEILTTGRPQLRALIAVVKGAAQAGLTP